MEAASSSAPTFEDGVGQYQYEDMEPGSIRVFRIQPANGFDCEVCGELVTMRLTSDEGLGPYNALSYSWGHTYPDGSHLSETIQCGERELRVTPGLKTALRYIRSYGYRKEARAFGHERSQVGDIVSYRHFASRPIWIDAICINQANSQERAHQVELMASIYEHSMSVLVWLGEPNVPLQSDLQMYLRASSPASLSAEAGTTPRRRWQIWKRERPLSSLAPNALQMLKRILELSWFKRRWVLQELLYARECNLLIGHFVCSRMQMQKLLQEFGLLHQAAPLRPRGSDEGIVHATLLEAGWQCDKSRATDPRDLVFALKHMSQERSLLKVDYDASVRDVFLQAMTATVFGQSEIQRSQANRRHELGLDPAHTIRCIQMLAVASSKRSTAESEGGTEVESWLPDWRSHTRFASPSHKMGVEMLMLPLGFSHPLSWRGNFSVPRALEFTTSGYCYLEVAGARLWRPAITDMQLDNPHGIAIDRTLRFKLPTPQREADCIWFPYVVYEADRVLVGFVLRGGSTRATYHGKSAYALHSCFVLRNSGPLPDLDIEAIHRDDDLENLTSFRGTRDVKFYLE